MTAILGTRSSLAATGAGKVVRRFPLVGGIDVAGQHRLRKTARSCLIEVGVALPDAQLGELARLFARGLPEGATPHEVNVLEAQLLGWIRGMLADATMRSG